MAARYISVTLEDFEKVFNVPHKTIPGERAFNLYTPSGQEAYYQCVLKDDCSGILYLNIYTSIKSGANTARDVGKDAIRLVLLWKDKDGWQRPVGKKPSRVFRSGGKGSSAADIVKRTINRAREVAIEAKKAGCCSKCNRPMVKIAGQYGDFYGCVGYNKGCK